MSGGKTLKIGLVGPCAAGKTTLARGLEARGYIVRQIAQEHSYVQDMWKKVADPDVLIFLDVSHPVSLGRRPQNFTVADYQRQVARLENARQKADLYLPTDDMTINQVLVSALRYLQKFAMKRDSRYNAGLREL